MAQITATTSQLGMFGKFKCEFVVTSAGTTSGDFYISRLQEVDYVIPFESNQFVFGGSCEVGSVTIAGPSGNVTKTNAVKVSTMLAAPAFLLLGR